MPKSEDDLLKMTNDITVAFLTRNAANPGDVADLMRSVHAALVELAARELPVREPPPKPMHMQKPAVPVSESITPDWLACLECGRKFKSLRFHLRMHGLSHAGYRAKWDLPANYPTVAPQLGKQRSTLAHASNFGHYRTLRGKKRQPAN